MPTNQKIKQQIQKWKRNGQFLELEHILKHTAYSIHDLAEMLKKDEKIYGYITAKVKSPGPFRGYAARRAIILTNKRLMFLSKGDKKSLTVGSVVAMWEIPLKKILSVEKQKGLLTNKIIVCPYKNDWDVIQNIPAAMIDTFFEALTMAIEKVGK
jgi:hypothetical protein